MLFPTRRLATARRTGTHDTSCRCLPPKLLDYEHPYSSVPGASTRCTPRGTPGAEAIGFGAYRVAGGAGGSRHLWSPLRRAASLSASWAATTGVFSPTRPMPPTSDIRVAAPAPVLDEHRAFARRLLVGSRQDQTHRRPVTGDDVADRGCLPPTGTISRRR